MWYAISYDGNRVVAMASSLLQCSDIALLVMPWGAGGGTAPYFITTRPGIFRAVFPLHLVKE